MAKVERIDRTREAPITTAPSAQQKVAPPTLGAGTPTPESVAERRDLVKRFRQLPWQTRNIGAPIQTFVRNLPVVGKNLSGMMSEGGDETAIQGYQAENPMASFAARAAGQGVPFLVGGPTSLAGRAAYSGLISGADALSEGEDPIVGGATGAVAGLLGSLPNRIVTPRSEKAVHTEMSQLHESARRFAENSLQQLRANRPAYDNAFRTWMVRNDPISNGKFREWLSRNADPSRISDRNYLDQLHGQYMRTIHRRDFEQAVRAQYIQDFHNHSSREISPRSLGGIENINPFIRGFGAAVGGHLGGLDPITSGAVGMLAGPAARMTRQAGERVINDPLFFRWSNNQLLPHGSLPERMLQGAATGAAQEQLNSNVPQELKPFEAILSQIRGTQ